MKKNILYTQIYQQRKKEKAKENFSGFSFPLLFLFITHSALNFLSFHFRFLFPELYFISCKVASKFMAIKYKVSYNIIKSKLYSNNRILFFFRFSLLFISFLFSFFLSFLFCIFIIVIFVLHVSSKKKKSFCEQLN